MQTAIIVLGKSPVANGINKVLKARLDKAIDIFNKNSIVIVSGKGKSKITEAEAMQKYLIKHNVPKNKIIQETESMDTLQNALYTQKIIQKLKPLNVIVITSNFHLKRTKFIFKKVFRQPLTFIGTRDYLTKLHKIKRTIKEFFYIFYLKFHL
jgi:uncharacterized SAM-binding protein YcdF (DUF218 family)